MAAARLVPLRSTVLRRVYHSHFAAYTHAAYTHAATHSLLSRNRLLAISFCSRPVLCA